MRTRSFWIVVICLSAAVKAWAASTLTLIPSVKSGVGTNEVLFSGVITNTNGVGNLFLNNVEIQLNGAATNYLAADTNAFFANVSGLLLPGESYSDVIFGVTISPATPAEIYAGTITIVGGASILAAGNLASQSFEVSLLPTGLSIAKSGTNVVLWWSSSLTNLVQQNSNVVGGVWESLTNAPTSQDGQYQLVLPATAASTFYRIAVP